MFSMLFILLYKVKEVLFIFNFRRIQLEETFLSMSARN